MVLIAAALVAIRPPPSFSDNCIVHGSTGKYSLDPDQAANAATIAAVGKRDGMPDHAVTIALAAAMQESKLRNLSYGDLDSVGLFQQRPSQGWGTRAQLQKPSYAAAAFYRGLQKVPDWATLPISDAAQQVQRSAAPDAYAQWEPAARTQAEVLTGEVAAGLSCQFAPPTSVTATGSLRGAITEELGSVTLGPRLAPAKGWTLAHWLVAHAQAYRITFVSFAGQRWTPTSGAWRAQPSPLDQVQLGRAGLAAGADPLGS
ncbi:MAG: hypothetical protein NVSMB32_09030 [Actinomycetota bacterium]